LTSLSAGVVFWNEKRGLDRLLPTLKEFDYVYLIDGRFKMMEGDSNWSTDGSRWTIDACSNAYCYLQFPSSEPEHRNKYLEKAGRHHDDYLLVIDADEWIEGDVKQFRKNLPQPKKDGPLIYGIEMIIKRGRCDVKPRLFYKPGLLRYSEGHAILQNKITGVRFNRHASADMVKGITIHENDDLRTKEHIDKIYRYQEKLIKHEIPIREALRRGH